MNNETGKVFLWSQGHAERRAWSAQVTFLEGLERKYKKDYLRFDAIEDELYKAREALGSYK